MTSKLNTLHLKSAIVGLAAQGRHLRNTARKAKGLLRHNLKGRASWVGDEARDHLLAYALVRGRPLEGVESPKTRTVFDKETVLRLCERFYTESSKTEDETWNDFYARKRAEKEAFLADAKEKLDAWYSVCRKNADLVASGGLAALKEAA